jgi:hypothetical protein
MLPQRFNSYNSGLSSVTEKFSQLYHDLFIIQGQQLNVLSISNLYQIQYRRVYDFIGILQYLGICQLIDRKQFFWKGLDCAFQNLIEKYTDFEIQSLSADPFTIFSVGKSPSLGKISLHLIFLSLFLGLEILNLKTMLQILSSKEIHQQSLQRRIYLVLTFLRICGIVKQNGRSGEFAFILPRDKFYSESLNQRKLFLSLENSLSIESIMNRLDGTFGFYSKK